MADRHVEVGVPTELDIELAPIVERFVFGPMSVERFERLVELLIRRRDRRRAARGDAAHEREVRELPRS